MDVVNNFQLSSTISLDLSPWLNELNTELTGTLADMANTIGNIKDGSYERRAQTQRVGPIKWIPDPNSNFAERAASRAAEACFRSAIDSFISFLDRLIAMRQLTEQGLVIDRDLVTPDDVINYFNARVAKEVAAVARDTSLSNPKKLNRFPGLSDSSRSAAEG